MDQAERREELGWRRRIKMDTLFLTTVTIVPLLYNESDEVALSGPQATFFNSAGAKRSRVVMPVFLWASMPATNRP